MDERTARIAFARTTRTISERDVRAAFARTIRTARGDRTQLGLGTRTGIAQTTWARWERGEGSPTAARLPEIADALGVPLADLLGHWLHEMATAAEETAAELDGQAELFPELVSP